MAGAYPHKKEERVFYIRKYAHTFPVKALDQNGKPIQKTNPATGMPIYLPNGDPEFIEKFHDFKPWKTKFCADGYVAVFVITKDTDKRVIEAVEKEARDRGSEVMDEKTFIASVNPELAARIAEEEASEKLLGEKDGEIKALSDEVAALKRRLSGGKN